MEKTCRCGRTFVQKPGPGRPRVRCEVCRPPEAPRSKATRSTPRPPAGGQESAGELTAPQPGLLERYTEKLRDIGRLDSAEGAHVLFLAGLLAGGGHTASGAAALSRELRAAVAAAATGAKGATDPLDELARRREQKATGA